MFYKVIYSLVAIPLPLYFEHPKVDTRHMDFLCYRQIHTSLVRERSGSVVECLTQDRGAVGLSLTALWSLSKTHLSQLSTGSSQEDPSLFN